MLDTKKALEAQKKYCDENNVPQFAPTNGRCDRCFANIYDYITVERAGTTLITGCPECHTSFVD